MPAKTQALKISIELGPWARRAAISVMPDVAPAPATVAAAVVTMLLVE